MNKLPFYSFSAILGLSLMALSSTFNPSSPWDGVGFIFIGLWFWIFSWTYLHVESDAQINIVGAHTKRFFIRPLIVVVLSTLLVLTSRRELDLMLILAYGLQIITIFGVSFDQFYNFNRKPLRKLTTIERFFYVGGESNIDKMVYKYRRAWYFFKVLCFILATFNLYKTLI